MSAIGRKRNGRNGKESGTAVFGKAGGHNRHCGATVLIGMIESLGMAELGYNVPCLSQPISVLVFVGLGLFVTVHPGRTLTMRTLIALAFVLVTVPASAQNTGSGMSMNGPNYSTLLPSTTGRLGLSETPTMRANKLERAIALRAEADALLEQDGGKLTPTHEAYVRRKACAILGDPRAPAGSLVPERRCT